MLYLIVDDILFVLSTVYYSSCLPGTDRQDVVAGCLPSMCPAASQYVMHAAAAVVAAAAAPDAAARLTPETKMVWLKLSMMTSLLHNFLLE